jgi:hypothetical protein
VTRGTFLGGSGRKGLTRAGGSMVAQTEWRGVTMVAQRTSQGRWCGARGGVGRFGGGLGQRFAAAQRWQAQRQQVEEEERVAPRGRGRGGAPFIATGGGWQMAARVAVRRRRCLDRVADERGPHYFIFSQIIQTGSNIEM